MCLFNGTNTKSNSVECTGWHFKITDLNSEVRIDTNLVSQEQMSSDSSYEIKDAIRI
jgi:hypothetical protein